MHLASFHKCCTDTTKSYLNCMSTVYHEYVCVLHYCFRLLITLGTLVKVARCYTPLCNKIKPKRGQQQQQQNETRVQSLESIRKTWYIVDDRSNLSFGRGTTSGGLFLHVTNLWLICGDEHSTDLQWIFNGEGKHYISTLIGVFKSCKSHVKQRARQNGPICLLDDSFSLWFTTEIHESIR